MTDDVRAALLLARSSLLSGEALKSLRCEALDAINTVLDAAQNVRAALPTDTAWLCGRGHTTRQPTCPACHDVAYARRLCASERDIADAGHYSARELLKAWVAEDLTLPRTVTIDAELLDLIITILHETFYDGVNYPVDVGGVLEQLKAAREGR